jgi:putative transposase
MTTALKISSHLDATAIPPPAPRGVLWIDAATAAERSKWDERTIRRRCGEEWLAAGLARIERSTGLKTKWMVREDAHPKFAVIKFADQLSAEFELRTLSESQRQTVTVRKRIVGAWQAELAAGVRSGIPEERVTAEFVGELLITENRRVSGRTLYRWAKLARDGIGGLVDGRGSSASKDTQLDQTDDRFISEIKRLWLRQSRPGLKTCYDHAMLSAEDGGWPICSLKTAQRRIAEIPPQVVVKMREGESAFANTVLPAPRRDYSAIRSNEWWCSDHHQFDVIVKAADGKLVRPWITCWQDLRSRKIVGWHIFTHDPNTSTILLSLRSAALAEGLPENAYIDNGKDFDSYTLQGQTKTQRMFGRKIKVKFDDAGAGGVLGALGIKVVHAIAFNAKAKPVERFFTTLCARFSKFLPTYCGRNPQEKPENLADQLARNNAPTIDDFSERFAVWLDADYNGRVHEGDSMDGMTPEQAFEKCLVSRRVARASDLQLLIQKTSKPLIAGRYGITWDGIGYGRGDAALFSLFGKKVYLRVDPDDVTIAAVYTLDDKFVADVKANIDMPFGATEQEFRAAARERKQIRELTNRYHQLGPRRYADTIELMSAKRADNRRAAVAIAQQNAAPVEMFQSPVKGRVPKRKNSMKIERAAASPAPKSIDLFTSADSFPSTATRKNASNWLGIYEEEPEERHISFGESIRPMIDKLEQDRQQEEQRLQAEHETRNAFFGNYKSDGTHG